MKRIGVMAVIVLVACGVAFWMMSGDPVAEPQAQVPAEVGPAGVTADGGEAPDAAETADEPEAEGGGESATEESAEEPEPEEPKTEEELREEAEEKLVNAFDELTDKWMEPSEKGVTMKDIETFCAQFRKVPKERKDECVHRALNLVPDANVMLLAGILMDKTQDKEIVETVYNDILNRDEDVKKPILQQIFKDKTHPCWADTAWILDVTDELPGKKKAE